MAEIASEAGVAVGTVYTRFPSKDALLAYVFEVLIFPKIEKKIDAVLSPTRTRSETLYQFTCRYLWAVRNVFLAHRATLIPLTLISRQSPDPELRPASGPSARTASLLEPLRRCAPTPGSPGGPVARRSEDWSAWDRSTDLF